MSKITEAVAKITGSDPSEVVYDKIIAAQKSAESISIRLEKKNAERIELERKLSRLALAAAEDERKMPAFEKAKAEEQKIENELSVLRIALRAAGEAVFEAETEFAKVGKAKVEADIKRKNGERNRHATRIEELLAELAKEWREYFVASGRLATILPGDIPLKGGTMLKVNEILGAMSKELRRHKANDLMRQGKIKIAKHCVQFQRQFAGYERDETTGKPIARNDDLMSAFRVGVMMLRAARSDERSGYGRPRVTNYLDDEQWDIFTGAALRA
jgi:hypothetical protein